MKFFIYQDTKYQPIMVYAKREYPYGKYVGHFETMAEAETTMKDFAKNYNPNREGIPICDALVNFQKDHGAWDMEGLTLLQEVEV